MQILKTSLAASTALCLSMGIAHAGDDNNSFIDQQGDDNSAAITQSGDRNDAGRSGDDMLQNGANNSLTIDQTGDDNQVGASAVTSVGSWTNRGVEQQGDNNSATVTQSGPYGVVNELYQESATGATGATNTLTITQEASSPNNDGSKRFANVISRVEQIHGGGAENKVTISQDRSTDGGHSNWGRNVIGDRRGFDGADPTREGNIEWGVQQDGSGNAVDLTQIGDRNAITHVRQTGDDNSATVSQDNTGSTGKDDFNLVQTISQNSTGYVIGNTASIVQEGLRNGQPNFASGSYSGMAGATARVVRQIGGNNNVDYKATGNDNGFGFYQEGTGNNVGMITVTGNANMLGVWQNGTDNTLALGDVSGDRNDVGVKQNGKNSAQINLEDPSGVNTSDDNRVWVDQNGTNTAATIDINGDFNDIQLTQGYDGGSGGTNSADIDVVGNSNLADLRQWGDNSATLNITGNFNNNTGASLSGAANTKTGLTTVGLMTQSGSGNDLQVTVTNSDNNLWATDQDGPGNTIVASISGGNGNQFGVKQTSTTIGNHTTVTQNGSGNNAGVSQ